MQLKKLKVIDHMSGKSLSYTERASYRLSGTQRFHTIVTYSSMPSRNSSVGRAFVCSMIGPAFDPTNAYSQVHLRDRFGYYTGCQKVDRCHTRDESQEVSNRYTSTKCK